MASAIRLFGFELRRAGTQPDAPIEQPRTFVAPMNDDGALVIQSGGYYGTYVDLDGLVKNEQELISRYLEMSMQPECEAAIDDITNEAIVHDEEGKTVSLILDQVDDVDDDIKDKIRAEFDKILRLLNFSNQGHDIFRRWYVMGRLYYHIIIDDESPEEGIKEVRYIDPRRIRKIREIQKGPDPQGTTAELVTATQEYYLYNDRGAIGGPAHFGGVRIARDSVVYVTSGLLDSRKAMVLSYLHKAIKPLNNLRMMEDAIVIYRLSRAAERRLFYIDVGSLPTKEAEKYLNSVMTRYRNKLVYDSATGQLKDDRKWLAMTEDFWIPRREGKNTTEVDTLSGGQNLDQISDVEYFQKRLYMSLNVPITRLTPGEPFTMGFTNEISRDELKFSKFIERLRNRFTHLFDDLLRVQLVTKKICTEDEWHSIKEKLHYDFLEDNNYSELKDQQLITQRIQLLGMAQPFIGTFFSKSWIQKNVLRMDDDEIELMEKEIDEEGPLDFPGGENGAIDPTTGMPLPMGQQAPSMMSGAMPQQSMQNGPGGSRNKPRGEEPKLFNGS